MNILTVFGATSLLFCLCSAQNMHTNQDPDSVDKCEAAFNRSTPDNPLKYWDATSIGEEWFEYVRKTKRLPQKYKNDLGNNNCEPPDGSMIDTRRFYWGLACPYDVFWLGKFKWQMQKKRLKHKTETCYVLSHCLQPVRAINCTTDQCQIRGNKGNYRGQNTACFETTFLKFRVWIFCTETYKKKKPQWVDCKKDPDYCLKCVTLYVPQCCECYTCKDMRRKLPPAESEEESSKTSSKSTKEKSSKTSSNSTKEESSKTSSNSTKEESSKTSSNSTNSS